MSAGVVFVELADADAVGQACSSQFATSGVVIKAGQPYEVRTPAHVAVSLEGLDDHSTL